MIKSIDIEGLFGRFHYSIPIDSEGITIITGPNGFGKSTILKIVSAISSGNLNYFNKLDFQKIVFSFDNNEDFTIAKRDQILYIDNNRMPDISRIDIDYFFQYGRRAPWISKTQNGFFDRRSGTLLTEDQFYYMLLFEENNYSEQFLPQDLQKALKKTKNQLDKVRHLCGEVRLISDQRLIRTQVPRDEAQVVEVITGLPQKLKDEISKVVAEYSQVSSRLDSSYPKRLLSAKEGIKNQEEYSRRLEEANKKFEKLNEYNLVDMSLIDKEDYNQTYSTALKVYFDDFYEKYKVFEELIEKLDLFTTIINNRLTFKRIRVTPTNGFEVVDVDNPAKSLELHQLSSGEKQEIVLFYDLIFSTKENLLLLIDEPEISLHIIWQKMFLDDLLEVSKRNKLQAIVATHSPQIISNHLDIQIDLGGLYYAELNKR